MIEALTAITIIAVLLAYLVWRQAKALKIAREVVLIQREQINQLLYAESQRQPKHAVVSWNDLVESLH